MKIKKFTPSDHKIKALIYGPAGCGKTVFGGTAKKAIFASAEGGLLSIADKHPEYTEIKTLRDLRDLYSYLKNEDHSYETVVIDSVTEINEIIKGEIEKRTGHSMQLQDWGVLAKEMRELLRNFRDLPMHVIFITQENYIQDESKIKIIAPSLNGKTATDIAYFMDIVGYMHIEADGTRWIETNTNKRLLTKDRSNMIGNDAPLDFSKWQERVAKIKVGKEKEVVDYEEPVKQAPKNEASESNGKKLLKELKKRGANTADEALKMLNEAIGTKLETLIGMEEADASKYMIQLMQVKPKPASKKKTSSKKKK